MGDENQKNGQANGTAQPPGANSGDRPTWLKLPLLFWAIAGTVVALGLVFLRGFLVVTGVLYGTAAVGQATVFVAGGVVLVLPVWFRYLRLRHGTKPEPVTSGAVNWFSTITAFAGVVALLISGLNLLVPAQAPDLAKPACPGVRDRNADYVGITASLDGVNSRNGPARSYQENGRFPNDCSIAFSTYCIGEPITDSTGTIGGVQTWVTSRWLLIAKQGPGWGSWLARLLSDENPAPQFVSDAFITPETPFATERHDSSLCGPEYPSPGRAHLRLVDSGGTTGVMHLSAQADHAVNMGFGIWIPPDQGFSVVDNYTQIFNKAGPTTDNPGMTDSSGTKTASWDYRDSLLDTVPAGQSSAVVVIMAVPCIADNFPADDGLGDLAAYHLAAGAPPAPANVPPGLDAAQLARAACRAND